MPSPINILELRSVRGTGGGPEKTILLGAARTDPAQFAITVCYLRDDRDDVFGIDEWARDLGLAYTEIRERHSFDPVLWPRLRALVRSARIDIVHAHDYKTNLLAWMLARTDDVVALSTVHGWTGHSRRERLLYYPVDKRVLARFPRLIAVSSEIRDELVRSGASRDRITVVLNGIDHVRFARDDRRASGAREELGIAPDAIVIGAVGRLEPQKRFDLLIDAFARLHTHDERLRLIIAGDGSLRTALSQQIAGLGLEDRCHLLGHRGDVAGVHHALDLFVQSSDYEGTPNAVLEAMALGSPVVATNVGGTGELIADGVHGRLIPPGDAGALTTAIDWALGDPSTARAMARAARARIEQELSFERRMQRVEGIYRELATPRSRSALTHRAPSLP